MAEDHDIIAKEFADAVNITPAALEKWLTTVESKEVGWKGQTAMAMVRASAIDRASASSRSNAPARRT